VHLFGSYCTKQVYVMTVIRLIELFLNRVMLQISVTTVTQVD